MRRWAVLVAMIPTLTTWAARPLVVDDAGTVDPHDFQLEGGCNFVHNGSVQHFDVPLSLSYGAVRTLQVGIGSGGQLEERDEAHRHQQETVSDFGDLTLGAKWNPLSAERFWADQALAVTVKFPTSNHDKDMGSGATDFDLMYLATKSVGEKLNVDFNVGYTWVGDSDDENLDDSLHYGLALRWQVTERVELVGEVFADTPMTAENYTCIAFNAGVRYEVVDDLVLDAAAGAGLRGDAPDWTATTGFTWTFGFGGRPKDGDK
jgi:hypothetical protein